jgi:phosphoribosylformylglycinamidine (FGAM) synthase PurS component
LQIEAATKQEAFTIAEEAAKKLLANQVMEEYSIQII